MNAALVGTGKMGRAIEAALRARGHQVTARIGRDGDWPSAAGAQIAFEFTAPASAAENVARLITLGIPMVCGTTGWDSAPAKAEAKRTGVPLLIAENFSVGAFVMRELTRIAAERLRRFPEFEPGIVERHHREKKDSPSGTARALAGIVDRLRPGLTPVAIASLRQGEQPGDHQLIFEGPEESLEIIHRVRSRGVFAEGAVRAGEWLLAARPRGAVTFEDFIAGGGS
jgi:4-hydroxy-tetrahydrodipicolinate reductase